eukprot:CAMPEP_0194242802 /NCGR_PEP_ID=MMETSP0158-20130606/8224_1 /TAXON_ID=33649 /ORGANISM="Thalassionema nitzschioides, Strain L26-B" /LENGTH=378 /DNA_ID=CAMNT_0038977963 /DNA_START=43 /DNA_END=1179 /DNA_ORIENTATION=+
MAEIDENAAKDECPMDLLSLEDSEMEGMNLLNRSLSPTLRRTIYLESAKTVGTLRNETKLLQCALESVKLDMENDEKKEIYPTEENMILGRKLGQGGFSSVYEVKDDPTVACKFLSNSSLRVSDDDTAEDKLQFLKIASRDIVREFYFLDSLNHPNIISLRGVGSLDDMASYYLLLEKISMPLSEKMKDWELARVDNDLLRERLEYVLQIASAFSYLHERKIIYRDLKIDNLGLTAEEKILVYDFGLAKEIKDFPCENGKYKLSGGTGSWAYMAPEVAKNYRYNFSADVYSYGIVLWEICSGRYAFSNLTKEEVLGTNERPPLVRNWPDDLETLMKECWHWNLTQRPSFPGIEKRVKAIMEKECPQSKSFFAGIFTSN